jgi:hypothetical protein
MARIRLRALATVAFAACLAAALAGCSTGRFLATLPDVPGDYFVDAQPVELLDLTGLVTALEPFADPELPPNAWTGMASAVPGDSLAVRVMWGAGMCEDRTRMRFEAVGSGYTLRIEHDNSVGAMIGCPAALVFRGATLRFSEPIDPLRIAVTAGMS